MLSVLLAAAGLFAGLRLASPGEYETPLGRVSVHVTPHTHGTLEAYVPLVDWGVRLRPFTAPVMLHVEPRTVDRDLVVRAASGDPALVASTERELRAALHRSVRRGARFALCTVAVVALVVGLILAAAGIRRPLVLFGVPGLILAFAGLLVGATYLQADRTFREDALERPTFYARGAELVQLLDAAEHAREAGDGYTSKVEGAIRGFASLLSDPDTGVLRDTAPGLLASDLHNNRFALDSLQEYARGKAVFFAGDFGNTGSRTEARQLVPRIARTGRSVVAVSGNHDSAIFMRELAREGATVLTRRGVLRARRRPTASRRRSSTA